MVMYCLTLVLAAVWGGIWAAFIQFVPIGRFLATKRTWITVVVGVGVDLLIAWLVVPWEIWWKVVLIVAVSSVPIIVRSLANEWGEWREVLNGTKDTISQQDDLGA